MSYQRNDVLYLAGSVAQAESTLVATAAALGWSQISRTGDDISWTVANTNIFTWHITAVADLVAAGTETVIHIELSSPVLGSQHAVDNAAIAFEHPLQVALPTLSHFGSPLSGFSPVGFPSGSPSLPPAFPVNTSPVNTFPLSGFPHKPVPAPTFPSQPPPAWPTLKPSPPMSWTAPTYSPPVVFPAPSQSRPTPAPHNTTIPGWGYTPGGPWASTPLPPLLQYWPKYPAAPPAPEVEELPALPEEVPEGGPESGSSGGPGGGPAPEPLPPPRPEPIDPEPRDPPKRTDPPVTPTTWALGQVTQADAIHHLQAQRDELQRLENTPGIPENRKVYIAGKIARLQRFLNQLTS